MPCIIENVQVFIKNFHDKVKYLTCKLAKSTFHFMQAVKGRGIIIVLLEITDFAILFPSNGKDIFPSTEKGFE
jgi:hypothetical protein